MSKIIINKVDVSKCGYLLEIDNEYECLIKGLGTNESILYCNCRDNPNCYYKQLQRKTNKADKLEHATVLYLAMLQHLIKEWYNKDIFKSTIIKQLKKHYEESFQYCLDDTHFVILTQDKYNELIKNQKESE